MPLLNLRVPRHLYFQDSPAFKIYNGSTLIGYPDPYWRNVICYIHARQQDEAIDGFFGSPQPNPDSVIFSNDEYIQFEHNGYVSAGKTVTLSDPTTITVDFWGYFQNTSIQYALFSSPFFRAVFYLSPSPDTTPSTLTILSGSDTPTSTVFNLSSTHSPPPQVWRHFCIQKENNNFFSFFINGNPVATQNFTSFTGTPTGNFILGSFKTNSNTVSYNANYFRFKNFRVTTGVKRFSSAYSPSFFFHRTPITLNQLNPDLYLDSTNESSLTLLNDGTKDRVVSWGDSFDNNYTATQNTASDRPYYELDNTINKKVIKFEHDFLKISDFIVGNGTTSDLEIFIVASLLNTSDANGGLLNLKKIGVDNDWNNSWSWNILSRDDTTSNIKTEINGTSLTNPTLGYGNFFLVHLKLGSDGTFQLYLNGDLAQSQSSVIFGLEATEGLTIGKGYRVNDYFWDGSLCQIMIFKRSLTNSEKQLIEGWLAWKSNISSLFSNTSHPHKYYPPYL